MIRSLTLQNGRPPVFPIRPRLVASGLDADEVDPGAAWTTGTYRGGYEFKAWRRAGIRRLLAGIFPSSG